MTEQPTPHPQAPGGLLHAAHGAAGQPLPA
ncbi:hypothetical protein GA0115257_104520, partial [Streptomyces sp. LcepLS]